MKKVLVTGGAGFIGSNFVKYILENYDYDVVNYDLLTYAGNINNLKEVCKYSNYTFVKGNIRDRKQVNSLFDKYNFDFVVHFAAESHVDNSINNPGVFVETNVLGTQVLIDSAKKNWVVSKDNNGYPVYRDGVKFMHVSTDEVYGSLGKTGLFTELSQIEPNSPYSATKAASDLLIRSYHHTFKFPMNISRCSNNYGPYQFPEKLIPLMIYNANHDIELPVYGDGMQIRDWLHVTDHCRAISTVLHKGISGEVYNIGGNNEKANIEIVKLILSEMNKSENLIRYVQDRLGHDRRYAIDNTKLSSELGWSPKYTFKEGIKETIKWYLEHQDWLEQIKSGEYKNAYKL